MMNKAGRKLFLGLMIILVSALTLEAENFLHNHISASLLVADPDQTAELIARWAEDSGGYYLLKSSDQVVIRFPFTEIGDLRSFLESLSDEIVEIYSEAVDLRENILGIQSGIRSREEILSKNLSFIDQADVSGTLAIEKEVMLLLEETENLKGRLRKLEVDRRFARAEIFLSFQKQSLPEDLSSSFDWINTVDFYLFMQEGF